MRLVLASASPRRRELLSAAGFVYEVLPVEVDETPLDGEHPEQYVSRLAGLKAASCLPGDGDVIVLAADTTVVVDGRILGKPTDESDARTMLDTLSGRDHSVLTGVAIRHGDRMRTEVETTRVHFLPLSAADLDWYVGSGEPGGKAGSYAVQGLASRFVDRVDGSYSNVVGLPVARVWLMLKEMLGPRAAEGLTEGGPSARY